MQNCNILPLVIIAIVVIIALYYVSQNPLVSSSNGQTKEGFHPHGYGYGYGRYPYGRYYNNYNRYGYGYPYNQYYNYYNRYYPNYYSPYAYSY